MLDDRFAAVRVRSQGAGVRGKPSHSRCRRWHRTARRLILALLGGGGRGYTARGGRRERYPLRAPRQRALACDLRFCAPHAVFALQNVQWGLHACAGARVRLPWVVGRGHAMEMFLSGDRLDAEWAARTGLINRVIAALDRVAETLAYAARLAGRAPVAQRLGKAVILRALGRPLEDGPRLQSRSFHDLGSTADRAAGTTAFREKRAAEFHGG